MLDRVAKAQLLLAILRYLNSAVLGRSWASFREITDQVSFPRWLAPAEFLSMELPDRVREVRNALHRGRRSGRIGAHTRGPWVMRGYRYWAVPREANHGET